MSQKIKVCVCGHEKAAHYSAVGGCKGCSCSHFRYDGAKSHAAQKGAKS